ncbi:MAG: thioredoxin family protein, partial [Azovibrio sp.]|nr:thioredoxin family protein [Azovibrio sp.]
FTSLVLALLWAGGHPPKVEPELLQQARELPGEHDFEVYMSLSCHNCPDVVQALALLALVNPRVRTTVIDGALFQHEVQERGVMAVPLVLRNGQIW